MNSNWPIWDFFKSYPKNSWPQLGSKICLASFDDLSLYLLRDHLIPSLDTNAQPITLIGDEINYDWFEEEFLALSFFQEAISYIILNPDDLNLKIKELLLSKTFDPGIKKIALAFSKDSAFQKKWSAINGVETLKIDPPKFWETQKLIDFCSQNLMVPLNFESKAFLLEAVDPVFTEIYGQLQQVKLNFPDEKSINREQLSVIIQSDYLDQFKLATEFGKKKFSDFFEKILQVQIDYERLRGFFLFMQNHLTKFIDTHYLKDKPRLTNYDKEILSLSKIWKQEELLDGIKFFHAMEIECKKKNPLILNTLRTTYLMTLWKKAPPASWKLSNI